MNKYPQSFYRDESGAVMVFSAILLVVLLGFGALAIDIGHLMVVKNELQNAADAGAMAGSRGLVPYINLAAPVPYWSNGEARARQAVRANKADQALLTDCQIEVGFWNFGTKQMQSINIMPTNLDAPAVRVTVRKTEGQNGGPVPLFLARVWGNNFADVSSTATSVISGPGAVGRGGLFPIAIAEQLVIDHWDDTPYYTFKIGSDYHYPDEESGQWTSFLVDENNVPYIRDLMDHGNPDKVAIGDEIWIQPGTKDTLWARCEEFIGQTVILPVVRTDFDTHQWTPVKAFVPFYINDARGGSSKYVQGHFVRDHIDKDAIPAGPNYGVFSPPKAVQ
ncbi:MAG: pilus assembly protein TadG-related protein [Desulfobaccales bacterium]